MRNVAKAFHLMQNLAPLCSGLTFILMMWKAPALREILNFVERRRLYINHHASPGNEGGWFKRCGDSHGLEGERKR
jgi:hypothetical protein